MNFYSLIKVFIIDMKKMDDWKHIEFPPTLAHVTKVFEQMIIFHRTVGIACGLFFLIYCRLSPAKWFQLICEMYIVIDRAALKSVKPGHNIFTPCVAFRVAGMPIKHINSKYQQRVGDIYKMKIM